jgi:hypothetical protein
VLGWFTNKKKGDVDNVIPLKKKQDEARLKRLNEASKMLHGSVNAAYVRYGLDATIHALAAYVSRLIRHSGHVEHNLQAVKEVIETKARAKDGTENAPK